MGLIDLIRDDRLDAQAVEHAQTLIRHFEGYRDRSYRCPGGVLTIGYGHTAPGEWQETGVISEEEAEMYLLDDIMSAWNAVRRSIVPVLNSRQKAAVVSFVFNLGATSFIKSTLLKEINAGNNQAASSEFKRWIYSGGKVLPGLVRRRTAESLVWSGMDPRVAILRSSEEVAWQ